MNELEKLYSKAKEIPSTLELTNKYSFLAFNKIVEAKYLDVNDILSGTDTRLNSYVGRFKRVLLFPNRVGDTITDIFVRPLVEKETPLKLGLRDMPFNFGNLQNMQYGKPLILVEGIADMGALKLLKSDLNIIVMNSTGLPKDLYELVSAITNNIYLLADNDNAGKESIKHIAKHFKAHGVTIKTLEQYPSIKDAGDILDKLVEYKKTNNSLLKDELEILKLYYLTQLKSI